MYNKTASAMVVEVWIHLIFWKGLESKTENNIDKHHSWVEEQCQQMEDTLSEWKAL